MNRNIIATAAVVVIATAVIAQLWTAGTNKPGTHTHEHVHEHAHEYDSSHDHHSLAAADAIPKGPHGGRLLSDGDFKLEITIYETGLQPEFRVYAYRLDQPVGPDKIALEIVLKRTGNRSDRITFTPQDDYLRGNAAVDEPHSFNVSVFAGYDGKQYSWHYDSIEGRTHIPDEIASEMGIQTETAGPVTLLETRTLTGRVQTNPNRISHVRPRFPGVVKAVHRELGRLVAKGDLLATLQSNESLQDYQVKAPIAGLIVKRDIQVGEASGDQPLFIIADLSEVWVELDVFVRDLSLVTSSCRVEGDTGWGLGVLGSTRMEYAHVVALVDHVARSLAETLRGLRS